MSYPSSPTGESLPSIPPLLARVMRPLPLLPLEIVLARFMQRICRRNPQIFDRLGVHAGKRFGIKPTDLPFAFVIEASTQRPRLSVMRELPAALDARISSSLANLLALVEGRVDGDALMFSRQLVMEGDVEAVLALRNAIDDAGLDLAKEVADLFGPLGEPVRQALDAARNSLMKPNPLSQETRPWS
ncbi:MAG: SCP2 sterol-binding domain-containing protein [Bradyrhizobium sp.]|uniref:ubiquinone anaerobic biosynthesis accessory factor UbiT n=1 Tax=Bradyrhizobium sp. TaxID=376 RepID=UPI0025BC11E6|nr:SCP2 sterol-binding domain-containing protein [Bradyrhizobium sp.]MBI5265579.1 SCP2 sterol-binding domain-containing protein [Bradyrhizobium sp.]